MVLLDSHNCAGKLKDKVAVVTGAGRGIGRAIAIAFAQAGAAVCCSARTETEILNTVSEIEGFGGRAIAKVADVTNPEAVHSMHEFAVNAFQGIDILVVNAGVSLNTSVANSDTEQWQNVLQTNLFGAYLTARAAVRLSSSVPGWVTAERSIPPPTPVPRPESGCSPGYSHKK